MRKIPTIFIRDSETHKVSDQVTPGCEWVFAGEGRATRKFDGTCVMYDGVSWWARREVKAGKDAPEGFVLAEYDERTGKSVGWEPAVQSSYYLILSEATEMVEAMREHGDTSQVTYELCGPKINGNPEGFQRQRLVRHGIFEQYPMRTFDGLRAYLVAKPNQEGLVFHHPDGRMAKIKRKDFS